MCRMILAMGNLDAKAVMETAIGMSKGNTHSHSVPASKHIDGWGMVWKSRCEGTLATYRNPQPIADSVDMAPLDYMQSHFLAVHVRDASRPDQKGIDYVHPIDTPKKKPSCYLMHNGFLPTMYHHIGKPHSDFDTQEYYEYLTHDVTDTDKIDESWIEQKLEKVDTNEDLHSANAFLMKDDSAFVINWTYPETRFKDFFQLYTAELDGTTYIASEPLYQLASHKHWRPLPEQSVKRYQIE